MKKISYVISMFWLCGLLCSCSSLVPKIETVHKNDQNSYQPNNTSPSNISPTATSPSSTTSIANPPSTPTDNPTDRIEFCEREMSQLPGSFDKESLHGVCAEIKQLENCTSANGAPILHYEKIGTDQLKGKRILAMSLIHGDEIPSGSVTRAWMTRLQTIDPRNTWRVLPLVNPDGVKTRSRQNARGVDLNRNFPSKDWSEKALPYWEKTTRRDPRRFPGESAASESETRCLVKHIEEFKPDFIISIHTPLGVLDFDGPRIANPGFKPLPWVGLGNFSGSLGRYMWVDNKVPVLTIELRGNSGIKRLEDFDQLQDISGTVAIQAGRLLTKEKRQ